MLVHNPDELRFLPLQLPKPIDKGRVPGLRDHIDKVGNIRFDPC